jgi:hypothetical protein
MLLKKVERAADTPAFPMQTREIIGNHRHDIKIAQSFFER